jgi:alanine dehydrogenase
MPGAVPITSTYALTNATLPYVLALAEHGVAGAARLDPGLACGVNVVDGEVTHPAVAEGVGLDCVSPEAALGSGPDAAPPAAPSVEGAPSTRAAAKT